jgi:hypothetical protein
MSDANRGHQNESNSLRGPSAGPSPSTAIFTVAFLAALGAAGTVYGLKDLLGLGVAVVIAAAGAAVAAFAAGKPTGPADVKAAALLEAVSADDAPVEPPSRFRSEPWGTLYRRAAGYGEAQRSATFAVQELERLRHEVEKKADGAAPFESRPTHADHELVGAAAPRPTYQDQSPETAVVETVDAEARAREAVAEAVAPVTKELQEIELELDPLVRSLHSIDPAAGARGNGQPAKMVDALVRTAADGIEDLAAGLMRANELAGVAERVTNRATLLALNAALEATRSGSEAFASIAEETRRLAEYAREATDTISQLSSEIELKVGETIGAIQTTSEDAKAAVETLAAGGDASGRAVTPETLAALESLLGRVRALRERTEAVAVAPARDTSDSPRLHDTPPVPAYVSLGEAEAAEDSASVADSEPGTLLASGGDDPSESADAHGGFGSLAFGDAEPPSPAPSDSPDAPTGVDTRFGDPEPGDGPVSDPDTAAADGAVGGERPSVAESAEAVDPEPHPSVGATPVVPKIPDWLEGLEPRDRR